MKRAMVLLICVVALTAYAGTTSLLTTEDNILVMNEPGIHWGTSNNPTFCELCAKPISVPVQTVGSDWIYRTSTSMFDGPWDGIQSREGASKWDYTLEHDLCLDCQDIVNAEIVPKLNQVHKTTWAALMARMAAKRAQYELKRSATYRTEVETKINRLQDKLRMLTKGE